MEGKERLKTASSHKAQSDPSMRGVAGRRLRQAAQPEDSAFMPAADAVFLSILYVAMEDLQETIMDLEAEDRPAQDPTATRCFGPDHPQPAPHGQASDGRSLEEFDESSVGTREIGPLLRGGDRRWAGGGGWVVDPGNVPTPLILSSLPLQDPLRCLAGQSASIQGLGQ